MVVVVVVVVVALIDVVVFIESSHGSHSQARVIEFRFRRHELDFRRITAVGAQSISGTGGILFGDGAEWRCRGGVMVVVGVVLGVTGRGRRESRDLAAGDQRPRFGLARRGRLRGRRVLTHT